MLSKRDVRVHELYRLLETDILLILDIVSKDFFPSNSGVNQCAVILRKWLCENYLSKIARELSVDFSFSGEDNSDIIGVIDSEYDYFLLCGVCYEDIRSKGIYSHKTFENPDTKLITALRNSRTKELKISQFKAYKTVFFNNRWITFEEIILFISNKKGGAHFDIEQGGKENDLHDLWDFIRIGDPQFELGYKQFMAIENMEGRIISPIEIELVTIACYFITLKMDGTRIVEISDRKFGPLKKITMWIRSKFKKYPRTFMTEKDDMGNTQVLDTQYIKIDSDKRKK
jgi:hypothetical protein